MTETKTDATEEERLAAIAADSWYAKGVNRQAAEYSGRVLGRHWRPGRCLELGPAEGVMTEILARSFDDLTLVEGSGQFVEALHARYPRAHVVHTLFEEFRTDDRFDTVVMGHILEHVAEPRAILQAARGWLKPRGVVCAAVPNARSLHRQAGVLMGMLEEEHALNEQDIHHGHRRVYDPESFRAEFTASGYTIQIFGGYWLKPVSNRQVETTWSADLVEAYMRLGERYPDVASEIYVVATA